MKPLRRFFKELRAIREYTDGRTFLLYVACIIASFPEILRTRNLKAADNKMHGKACVFNTDHSHRIILDGMFFSVAREIYCRRVYFAIPYFDINVNDVVVDLGANTGVFTALAALCGRKVIAVEAQSGFRPIIEQNLARNNVLNKTIVEIAMIGANAGVISIPSLRQDATHWAEEPPVLSLTDIIRQYDIDRVDFLKVDIEGSEFDLFTCDADWVSRVDKIAMEVHSDFGDVDHLVKVLRGHSFNVWLVDNEQKVVGHLRSPTGYLFAKRLPVHSAR